MVRSFALMICTKAEVCTLHYAVYCLDTDLPGMKCMMGLKMPCRCCIVPQSHTSHVCAVYKDFPGVSEHLGIVQKYN